MILSFTCGVLIETYVFGLEDPRGCTIATPEIPVSISQEARTPSFRTLRERNHECVLLDLFRSS